MQLSTLDTAFAAKCIPGLKICSKVSMLFQGLQSSEAPSKLVCKFLAVEVVILIMQPQIY